ncbi:four-helix bundle copper-binding protein [Hyphomicrobium sp.]|uniref:four-helix bundle copper-binding protein n=1 Tax=Hyphomicrobium sp. TaxID=82 RepID=UPI002E313664|nr:four-helix bundle copper-binding protein [Hyphomicrobium sp.]HEX2841431.1 four-helix bundle copper-binding protein [Hyphomicrobium sp.]
MHVADRNSLETAALSRRSLLAAGSAVLAGSGLIGSARSARAQDDPHAGHMDHSAHEGHGQQASQHQALAEAALDCVAKGEACVHHCVGLMEKGDKSLAECLKSVLAMMPLCTAVVRLASLDAPRLKDLAKLCGEVCAECEKVCRKHAEHHAVCKACAESCAAFVKESKKLTG